MVMNRPHYWSVVSLLGLAGLWFLGTRHEPELAATSGEAMLDSDGDMLPDHVEWVLLLDPQKADTNGDGTDDFLHAVQHLLPGASSEQYAFDHEMRIVTSSVPDPNAGRAIWINMMFRFAGAKLASVTAFTPFIDSWGFRFPLIDILGGNSMFLMTRQHPTEGLYLLISFRITSEQILTPFYPCTIGVSAVIDGKRITSGTYLHNAAGVSAVFVPISSDEFVVQTLSQDDRSNPFWSANRVCVMRLSVIGTSYGGSLCEVTSANCVPDGRLRCPPTCESSLGSITFFPDGMGTITGNR